MKGGTVELSAQLARSSTDLRDLLPLIQQDSIYTASRCLLSLQSWEEPWETSNILVSQT